MMGQCRRAMPLLLQGEVLAAPAFFCARRGCDDAHRITENERGTGRARGTRSQDQAVTIVGTARAEPVAPIACHTIAGSSCG